jgi:hypothetical protein
VDKQTFEFSSCGLNCSYEVVYAYRCCKCDDLNGREQQINILQISTSRECSQNCNTNDLQAAALIMLLERNPMYFKPRKESPGTSETMRAVNAQCLRSYYSYPTRFLGVNPTTGEEVYEEDRSMPPRLVLEMCERGGCCYQKMTVRRNADGSISIMPLNNGTGNAPAGCPRNDWKDEGQIIPDGQCYFNCNYLLHTRFTQQPIIQPSDDRHSSAFQIPDTPLLIGDIIVRSLLGDVVCVVQANGKTLRQLLDEVSRYPHLTPGVYSFVVRGSTGEESGTFVVKP